jgi:ubiquinone/menaquinone biosynthesis C-methylase UbiE
VKRGSNGITFDPGSATALPYPDASFDRVVSSLVFSLLSSEDKQRAVREAYRVLRGGGELHVADFGPPHTPWGRLIAPRMRRFEPISDNLDGRLPAMLRDAHFEDVGEDARFATIFGTISLLHGRRPG